MKFIFFLLITFSINAAYADPWGKDADLVKKPRTIKCQTPCCSTPLFGRIAEMGIAFHQQVISPADGPRSHYYPSSSQYTLDAMRKYGFFTGFFMGCDRLMRENPESWVYPEITIDCKTTLKYDPVK